MPTLATIDSINQGYTENFSNPLQEQLAVITRSLLNCCRQIWEKTQDKKEWEQEKQSLGWGDRTHQRYVKIWQWIKDSNVDPANLELLDERTITELCNEKFLEIWTQLRQGRMAIAQVRSQINAIRKRIAAESEAQEEAEKPIQEPSIFSFFLDKEGNRIAQITVTAAEVVDNLRKEFKRSGLPELLCISKTVEMWRQKNEELPEIDIKPLLPVETQREIAEEDEIQQLIREVREITDRLARYGEQSPLQEEIVQYHQDLTDREEKKRRLRLLGMELV